MQREEEEEEEAVFHCAAERSSHSQEVEYQTTEYDKVVTHLEPYRKSANLKLEIPSQSINFSSKCCGEGPCIPESSSRGSSSIAFSQRPGFKNNVSVNDGEGSCLLNPELASRSNSRAGPENAIVANFVAALTWKRCVSLPVTPASNLSPSASSSASTTTCTGQHTSHKRLIPTKVSRSLSVPTRNVVIVRYGSFSSPKKLMPTDSKDGQISPTHMSSDDEEIPEEEAVCRICFSGLSEEGRSWLKMECSCKGALQLTHEECALKWFSIKGNKNCDVCGQEVLNLPVTLFRVQSSTQRDNRHQRPRQSSNLRLSRAWQDVVVLVLISTMCYFFFLEQLLVNDMKSHAIIIAAPLSFTLGILTSLFGVTLACKEYVWAYSVFQFCLVSVFLHIFYSMLRLKAIYAIMFSAFAGFGTAMGVNSFCLHFFAWRAQVAQTPINANPA